MEWTKEAKERIAKVPFFISNRVKKRVEEEARQSGAKVVTVTHVQACQKKFLHQMEDEVKGYQVETCFGASGCPNQAVSSETLVKKIKAKLAQKNMKAFLKEKVGGPLKFHHEFRVSVSDCPNACSRPQIVDIGLIGARKPQVTKEDPYNQCAGRGGRVWKSVRKKLSRLSRTSRSSIRINAFPAASALLCARPGPCRKTTKDSEFKSGENWDGTLSWAGNCRESIVRKKCSTFLTNVLIFISKTP